MYVSTKIRRGSYSHSWASEPRNIPVMVTLGATPFLCWMIDSLNRLGVRELIIKDVQMDNTWLSSEFGMDQCK